MKYMIKKCLTNELEIIRKSVDKIGNKQGKKQIDNPEIREIIAIVEQFLKIQNDYVESN